MPPAQVYLIIKDVCPGEDEVIIITSSLMKDMNSKTDLYRSNAIRVLCSICGQDTQLLVQIERYLKQAIVDKVRSSIPSVCSGAVSRHGHQWLLRQLYGTPAHSGGIPCMTQ